MRRHVSGDIDVELVHLLLPSCRSRVAAQARLIRLPHQLVLV